MAANQQIEIVKSNGERDLYDPEKLKASLARSGASEEERERVVQSVEPKLFDGISSRKIYEYAHAQLKNQKAHRAAGRFRLKKAILGFGPSGYPFEIFVGRLFESFGFTVKVGELMHGKCVQHEVDVIADRPGERIIVEAKFRGDAKGKTTVQVPLYIKSRFDDIRAGWEKEHPDSDLKIKGFVVTNARFTQDAINYAQCVGLGLISWDYPADGSLKYFIDQSGLHPLTSLRSLRRHEQKLLLDHGIVLCRELASQKDFMREHGISDVRIKKILNEAGLLTKN